MMPRLTAPIALLLVVTLAAPAPDEAAQTDRALDWRFTEVKIVEGASPVDPFANIRSIASDGNSRFAVLDRTALQIHVFNSDGVHQWSGGRAGDGPGELRAPLSVSAGGEDSFIVTDQRHLRVSRYGRGGAHLGDVATPGNDFFLMESAAGPGEWYITLRLQGDDVNQMFRQRLFRWRPDSSETLATYDYRLRPRITQSVCPGLNASNDQRPLYEPDLLWSTNGSTVAWRGGWADYRIRIRESNGVERDIRRNFPAVAVTEQMAIAADGGRERVTAACRYDRIAIIRARGWAATRPFVQRLKVLPDGGLWVSRFSARGDTLIDVFDPRGTYTGTLPQGSRMPDAFLAGNRVVYRHTLPGSEPVVRIVQIVKN